MMRRFRVNPAVIFCALVAAAGIGLLLSACSSQQSSSVVPITISGVVADANGPVAGAIVQVQGTPNQTTSAADGAFTIHGEGLGGSKVVTMTAWSEGHFIGWVNLDPQKPIWQAGGKDVAVKLKPLYTVDNTDYTWFTFEGKSGAESCGLCHREYKEWQTDAHSQSATNPRFVSMYNGTDLMGHKGQLTVLNLDNTARKPDPNLPNYGPGYKLDYPDRAGSCAVCHAPVAANTPNQQNCAWAGCHTSNTADHAATNNLNIRGVSPVGLMGIGTEGVTCEFCHKVSDVIIDPHTHMPFPDMPGVLSTKLARPPDGEQLFFGTMTDVSRRVSYLPLEAKSEFCAACHYGVMGGVVGMGTVTGGTVIYNSYGEWLNSPWSDPKSGKTCQTCHMPTVNTNISVFPERGGIPRDYTAFHDHKMTGVSDQNLLWNALDLQTKATHDGATLNVQVDVTNDKTGHDVPTDSPVRSVMLVVAAKDAAGKTIALKQGPILPTWTGDYSGQPGHAYAKILKDQWSGETPTGAYWRPVTITEDSRLAPYATDTTNYSFDLPAGAVATIRIRLIYRRTFQAIALAKGFNDPDYTMVERTIPVEK